MSNLEDQVNDGDGFGAASVGKDCRLLELEVLAASYCLAAPIPSR